MGAEVVKPWIPLRVRGLLKQSADRIWGRQNTRMRTYLGPAKMQQWRCGYSQQVQYLQTSGCHVTATRGGKARGGVKGEGEGNSFEDDTLKYRLKKEVISSYQCAGAVTPKTMVAASVPELRPVNAGWAAMSDVDDLEKHFRPRIKDQLVFTCSRPCTEDQLTQAVEALDLLVQQQSYAPTSLFYQVLKRCTMQKDLVLGRRVHGLAVKSGFESDAFLANHIICMYASHGRLHEAMQVFAKVDALNTHVWGSIILAHARHGEPKEAMNLYRQMRQSSVKPDNHVFVAILKACCSAGDLVSGKEVHADILGSATEPDVFVGSCLVDMYSKCGSLDEARRVFDKFPTRDVVTWTTMIAGYAKRGLGEEALTLYITMQRLGIVPVYPVTFLCLLQAFTSIGALHQGQQLHAQIQHRGLEKNMMLGTCLVDMYAKCGSIEDARRVFDRLPQKNVVTWNSMMAGYAEHGLGGEALALYAAMQQEGIIVADIVTHVCLLKACANVGALLQGKQLHAQIQACQLETNVVLGTCLVDMYAKCGSLEHARKVFDRLPLKDVVTWNALLNGYAQQSDSRMVMLSFEEMQHQGVEPNDVTFICLLVACSHEGLVREGELYFNMMSDHGIVPTLSHYNCMVDLMGRSGHLGEAENVLQTMPFENNVVGWTSLLSACKNHGDVECGKRCFDHLVEMEPQKAAPYALLASMYSYLGRWRDAMAIENLRKCAGAKKKPAKACIEVKSKIHEFTVGEEKSGISSKLRSMIWRWKQEGGHVPHTELVVKAVPESEKEDALCGHAEKLALAYGLLNTPDGTTLLVTKNLRMCNDCHSGTKVMSRLEKREIVVRDAHRVHRFVNGSCSCRDWH